MIRFLLCALVLLVCGTLAHSQHPLQAPQVLQAPPVIDDTRDPYADAVAESIRTDKPLIVWYRVQPSRSFSNVVTVTSNSLPGFHQPGLILSVPHKGTLYYADTLPVTATVAEIYESLAKVHTSLSNGVKEVRQVSPPPFYELLSSAGVGEGTAEAESAKAAGPWPQGVPYLDGLVHYTPTRYTQSIATRDGRPAIDLVPRTALLAKWQVPGGMEGVRGWRSDLYKLVPYRYKWRARTPVKNSFGFVQMELGVKQEYPDGTLFMDVLSNRANGRVFEHRVREKAGGQWHSYVIYRDKDARPVGYAGIKNIRCADCHNEAGTGEYGVGLVPGGDTVLSDHLLD